MIVDEQNVLLLVVEADSTLVRDILVTPIRFVIDINKLYFPGIECLRALRLFSTCRKKSRESKNDLCFYYSLKFIAQ